MTTNVELARQGADAPVIPAARGAARLLAAIDDLPPELAARSAEIESARRIPADITDRLQRMGLFPNPAAAQSWRAGAERA
jgi:indole-3-acetate monooxygenase